MYQRMFNEEGKDFIGLIISPYYSTPADAATSTTTCGQRNHHALNCLPKLRCFITVKSKESETILPYEIALNILPQTRFYKDYLLREITELCHNPFSLDKINLKHETCLIKANVPQSVLMTLSA